MKLGQLLFTQGFGTRRECGALVAHGLVEVEPRDATGTPHDAVVVDDVDLELGDPVGLWFRVRGERWPYHERALIVLHKPAGYECSLKPRHHPSVYSLLPAPLRTRGVQPVGRLDEDTTGVLLFTDDGSLVHRLTSPKHKVPKVYLATVDRDLPSDLGPLFASGTLRLDGETEPCAPAQLKIVSPRAAEVTLTEGRYHQVRRMFAAGGATVLTLHRARFGDLALGDLTAGTWRELPSDTFG